MTTAMILLSAFAFANPIQGNGPPPILPPKPELRKQEWSLGGGAIIEVTFTVGDAVESAIYYEYCRTACRGNVHLLHEQCDASCDRACPEIHRHRREADLDDAQFSYSVTTSTEKDSVKSGLNRFGVVGQNEALAYSVSNSIETQLGLESENCDLDYELNLRHWNDKPCSSSCKLLRRFAFPIVAHWQLYRFDTAPDGRLVRVQGPSGQASFGAVDVPDRQAVPGPQRTYCKCSVVLDEPQHGMRTGGATTREATETGVCLGDKPGGSACTDSFLDQMKFNAVCQDMNTCVFSATNSSHAPVTLAINPGTFLIPSDPMVQEMAVIDRVLLQMGPYESVRVTVPIEHGPFAASLSPFAEVKGRVLCANMHRKEPNPSVKFTTALPRSIGISQLATFSSKQRFRGPREQTRMWIGTDGASLADIQKIMIPSPGEGTYVTALHEVSVHSQIDLTAKEFDSCFDPSLLVGGTADQKATRWMIAKLEARDAKRLVSWLSANSSKFAPLFADSAKDYDLEHAVTVANRLCASANPAVVATGIEFVLKAVPSSGRDKFANAGGLNGVGALLRGGDAALASASLSALETFGGASAKFWASNVGGELPANLKERAKKLAGG